MTTNNNHLRLPNKFQLMDKDVVIYDFDSKFGKLVGPASMAKFGDWDWSDLEFWSHSRVIPDGYPSTKERLARFDLTEWSWEAQLYITRGVTYLDFFWLRFSDQETFDNLPHKRSKFFPPMPDTEGFLIPASPYQILKLLE